MLLTPAEYNVFYFANEFKKGLGLPGESYPLYIPTRIEKSGPAMIVFWRDGTKTVVKRAADEPESDYSAFTAALGIKVFGSNSALKRIVASATEQKAKKRKGAE